METEEGGGVDGDLSGESRRPRLVRFLLVKLLIIMTDASLSAEMLV